MIVAQGGRSFGIRRYDAPVASTRRSPSDTSRGEGSRSPGVATRFEGLSAPPAVVAIAAPIPWLGPVSAPPGGGTRRAQFAADAEGGAGSAAAGPARIAARMRAAIAS